MENAPNDVVLSSLILNRKTVILMKYRCNVCGAVFGTDETVCPVCRMGLEHFELIPDEEDAPVEAAPSAAPSRYVILGTGIAALSAAKEIRALAPDARILMIGEEAVMPYQRTALTKIPPRAAIGNDLALHGRDFYFENEIQLVSGVRVAALDTSSKTVTLSDGSALSYDTCLYALGSHAFIPPIPGAHFDNVFTLRTVADAEHMADTLKGARSAVVIGGGVLGLEAAEALKKSGLTHVTVLEGAPSPLSGRADGELAARLDRLLAEGGIRLLCGRTVEEIVGEEKTARGVRTEREWLPADLILLSCGVRANIEIAREAGLACGRGVKVDAHMATDAPSVFACGDCAEIDGVGCGLWTTAQSMGLCAGRNAAGADVPYEPQSVPTVLHLFGTTFSL